MRYHLTLFFALLIVAFSSCTQDTKEETTGQSNTPKKLEIVTTTGMIGDVVKNVVGDKANVASLMGPGVDPHLYKATQGDLNRITEADIVFYNGLFLEGKMETILEKLAKKKPVYAVSEKLPKARLLDYSIEGNSRDLNDPHIWFDVDLWANTVDVIEDKMKKHDASNASFYTDQAKKYKKQLTSLHQDVKTSIGSIPPAQRILITSHDAFSYFSKAYDIEVEALQGISTVTEFGLKDISNLVDLIVKKGIKSIFVESSVASKPLEAVIEGCKKKGHNVSIGGTLYADAMGEEGTPAGTYIGMVRHNIGTIVGSLK